MGTDTNLKCSAVIRPEFRDKIAQRIGSDKQPFGVVWCELFNPIDYPFVDNARANHIPFCDNRLKRMEIFDGTTLKIDCCFKNYNQTIEAFWSFLNLISERIIEFRMHTEGDYDFDGDECRDIWYNWISGKREYV